MENEEFKNKQTIQRANNWIVLGDGKFIATLFTSPKVSEDIYEGLLAAGYAKEDITLIMPEETRNTYFPNNRDNTPVTDLGNRSLEGVVIGATIGGSIGALAAAVAAAGTTAFFPGLGVVLAGALAAAFAGVAAGGLVGALVGVGIPDDQATLFEEGLKKGGVIIGIHAISEEERITLYKEWMEIQNQSNNQNYNPHYVTAPLLSALSSQKESQKMNYWKGV